MLSQTWEIKYLSTSQHEELRLSVRDRGVNQCLSNTDFQTHWRKLLFSVLQPNQCILLLVLIINQNCSCPRHSQTAPLFSGGGGF